MSATIAVDTATQDDRNIVDLDFHNDFRPKIRALLARQQAEIAIAEQQLKELLHSSVPSSIKLLILEYIEQQFGSIKSIRDLIGRFHGDSDRRFVLLFRSLRLDVDIVIHENKDILNDRDLLLFVFKQIRNLALEGYRLTIEPLETKRLLDALLFEPSVMQRHLQRVELSACDAHLLPPLILSNMVSMSYCDVPSLPDVLPRMPKLRNLNYGRWLTQDIIDGINSSGSSIRSLTIDVVSKQECQMVASGLSKVPKLSVVFHVEEAFPIVMSSPMDNLVHCVLNCEPGLIPFQYMKNLETFQFVSQEPAELSGISQLKKLRRVGVWNLQPPGKASSPQANSARELLDCPALEYLRISWSDYSDWIEDWLNPLVLKSGTRLKALLLQSSFTSLPDSVLRSWCDAEQGSRLESIEIKNCRELSFETLHIILGNERLREVRIECWNTSKDSRQVFEFAMRLVFPSRWQCSITHDSLYINKM